MKYPRTYHLPWSPGATRDDRIQNDLSQLIGKEIIITEKLDGSNVMLSHEGVYARSHSGPPTHPSFDILKSLHSSVKYYIPEGIEIFGEWCYAKHSIEYSELPSYFMCFGIREHRDFPSPDVRFKLTWLSWEEVEYWCDDLDLTSTPVLYSGKVGSENELKKLVEEFAAQPSACGGEREGVVVRVARAFADEDFSTCVQKHVRASHVNTDKHWKNQKIVKNLLKPKKD